MPGLNCYSCPAASGACPIGAFQAVVGSSKFRFSYYITGFLILLGVLLGRFICGFLCPFGWFQELLHKIPTKKLSTKKLKPLTYLKYAVLLVMVFLLPAFLVNDVGMGDPFFCKYLCPQGVLEGAIPLTLANSGIRAALGKLFTWKFSILLSVIALSVLFYRCLLYTSNVKGVILNGGPNHVVDGVEIDACSDIYGCGLPLLQPGHKGGAPWPTDAAQPVSYTHLDVYKRQQDGRGQQGVCSLQILICVLTFRRKLCQETFLWK